MDVGVAAGTVLIQPEVCAGQILSRNIYSRRCRDIGGLMAFPAGNLRVLALQTVSRPFMVKLLLRSVPVNQVETGAVMLCMTLGTGSSSSVRSNQGRMKAYF